MALGEDCRVSVPPVLAGDPNLPERLRGVAVFIGERMVAEAQTVSGLPRSLRDVAGRVESAWWTTDEDVGADVRWLDGSMVPGFIAEGLAELVWNGRDVVARPVVAARR